MDINELKKATIYQSFEDLGMEAKNSKSKAKYDCLNIEPKDKVILDVWCNTGYFPIRFCQNGAKFVYWIDVDLSWGAGMEVIKLAKGYAKHYWIENIDFRIASVFDNLDHIEEKLDIITCTSTFHYFRDLQPKFFEICKNKLKKWGLIIREGGLPEVSEKYSRSVDEIPCHFPNEEDLKAMAKGFEVVYKWKSVDQKWDKIARYVLHFKKK